jgi:hypothetical protein
MALDLATVLRNLRNSADLTRVVNNPRTQFGTPSRRYLGAEILPERQVAENAFREETIKYRTIIANDGTRYSPVQLKGGALVGAFQVFLAESDIGSELTSQEYDALLNYLRRNLSLDATAQLLRWIDITINVPLVEINEKHRWEAIVDALVLLRGDNGYTEDVAYSNPSGHRAAAGGVWSNNAYDPMTDIHAMMDLFRNKGLEVKRIITSWKNTGILMRNDKIKMRGGITTLDTSGQIQSITGRLTPTRLNEIFQEDGLPPIETYDLRYRTSTGTARFMSESVMVFIAATGREESLDLGDAQEEILPDTLGYTAIGRAAGQGAPGRVTHTEAKEDKPPRIEAQGWQTSLPVITEPEGIAVIHTIS